MLPLWISSVMDVLGLVVLLMSVMYLLPGYCDRIHSRFLRWIPKQRGPFSNMLAEGRWLQTQHLKHATVLKNSTEAPRQAPLTRRWSVRLPA